MRVTRDDVAKMAGVAPSTVSYVLNNSRKLSAETVERVMNAVNEMGYKPDMIAKSLVKSKTYQLSIALGSILNPYYNEIVVGFENEAVANGYFVNICSGQNNLDGYFKSFISRRIDGLFILSLPDKYDPVQLYNMSDAGISIVSGGFDNMDLNRISWINSNYGEGMKLAIKYLYRFGHREIAYLTTLTGKEHSDLRNHAYLSSLKDFGLAYGDSLIFDVPAYSVEIQDGYSAARKMLESGKSFTAIICSNDLIAIGAIKALKENGKRVPEDISVIGFDNITYGKSWEPSITSVTHDKREFGRKAFELLNQSITQHTAGCYKANVYKGKSTGPVSGR